MIGILCNDRNDAHYILNSIFALCILNGIECTHVLPLELQEISYNQTKNRFSVFDSPKIKNTLRTIYFSKNKITTDEQAQERYLSPKKMISILKQLEKIINDKKIIKSLHILHLSYYHFNNFEFNSSFTLSWINIENWIFNMWMEYISNKKIPRDITNKMINMNIDIICNMLFFSNYIDENTYIKINNMRKKRNKIIHKGDYVTEVDAKEIIDFSLTIFKNVLPGININLPIKIINNDKKNGNKLEKISVVMK
jgi:hypothetical protein